MKQRVGATLYAPRYAANDVVDAFVRDAIINPYREQLTVREIITEAITRFGTAAADLAPLTVH